MKAVQHFLENIEITEALRKRSDNVIKSSFNRIYSRIKRTSDTKEIVVLNTELLLLIMETILKDKKQ